MEEIIKTLLTLIFGGFISLIVKDRLERRGHIKKLEIEHENDQRRKIKEILSTYKTPLIDSADALRGRLSTILNNPLNKDHYVGGEYGNIKFDFFQTSIYRLLKFYAWTKIIQDKIIFLDATVATDEDLSFLYYLECIKRTLQRRNLIDGVKEEKNEIDIDLIDRDRLNEMCSWMIVGTIDGQKGVITYTEFLKNVEKELPNYRRVCEFLDGVNPDENRMRWDRFCIFQLLIISFINSYGYAFQKRDGKEIKSLVLNIKNADIIKNMISHINKFCLNKEINAHRLIQELENYFNQKRESNKFIEQSLTQNAS